MFDVGEPILYMKVGKHAQEELPDIIERKRREIDRAGLTFWGYGGNTCHPTSMVQPFARTNSAAGHPIVMAMQPMNSNHIADPVRAEEYSADGINWIAVPESIDVLGSRYALCIEQLEPVEAKLDLSSTRVALGRSAGKFGSNYVRGRVDKACLEVIEPLGGESKGKEVPISLVARLKEPYAVFLRN